MADNNIQLKLELEIKEAVNRINQLDEDIKKVSNDLKNAKTDNLENGLKRVNNEAGSLVGTLTKIGVALGVGAGIGSSLETIANFQQSITRLGAVSGASATQLEQLKNKAMELGGSTEYSSSQVAEAMNYLAMAGFKTKQIMASVGDVLNLATIGQIDLGRASDISSNILSGFSMKASEMSRVVDVMAVTITNANTDISQLGEAMKYVAPNAKALGLSIEETAAAIGVLSNAGMQGSMAGTNLAMVLSRLSAPTGRAKKDLDKLGIQVYDTQGKFVGLKNVLEQLNEKMKNMTQEQKMNYLKNIFGQESLKAVLVLMGEVDKSYSKLLEKEEKANGTSEKMAQKMRDTLMGAWKTLQSAIEKLVLTIGDDLIPALTSFLKTITDGVNDVTDFYKAHKELIGILAELVTTFYGLNKALSIMKLLFGASMIRNIVEFGTAIKEAKGAVALLSLAFEKLGKANAVILAITASLVAMNEAFDKMNSEIDEMNSQTQKLSDTGRDFRDLLKDIENHMDFSNGRRQIRMTADELDNAKKKTEGLISATKKQIAELQEKVKNGGNLWDKMIGLDKTEEYKRQIDVLNGRLKALQAVETKLSNTHPFKAITSNTPHTTAEIEKVKKAQTDLLKELQKEAEVKKKSSQDVIAWYDKEKAKIDELLTGDKRYTEAVKLLNQGLLNKISGDIRQRVKTHESALNTLETKERNLANRIVEIQEQLKNRLMQLENERVLAVGSIEDRIKNLQMSGASEYQKYVALKQRADEKYTLAKKALESGNFQLAKSYMSQYSSLISQISNKEIKENGKVVVSKEQANRVAIANLKKLEALTNGYYAKEKAKAIEVANTKIRLIQAQLMAVKEEIKLSLERLKIEKQLIEAMTGKKVNIDTRGALNEIKTLDSQIKALDKQIKDPKSIRINADTTEAKNKVDNEIKKVENKKVTAKFNADTKQAQNDIRAVMTITDKVTGKEQVIKYGANTKTAESKVKSILTITDKATGKEQVFKYGADTTKAKKEIDNILTITDKATGKEQVIKLGADTKTADNKIEEVKNNINKTKGNVKVNADTTEAKRKIDELKKPTKSDHNVETPNFSSVVSKINSLNGKNTSSTHTIYVREVHTKATGGLIPLKRATGGDISIDEFKRINGKIPGYDPHDSDDVPALLTRGEFVVKRDAVQHYGEGLLWALNSKKLPKYATGGLIEQGRPDTIGSSDTQTNEDNTKEVEKRKIDLSTLDDLINKLDELKNTFKSGSNSTKTNETITLIKKVKKQEDEIKKTEEDYNNEAQKYADLKVKNKGKVLTESEFNKYKEDLSNEEKAVNDKSKKLDDMQKKADELAKNITKKIKDFESYIQKVDNLKDKIKSKLSTLQVDENTILPPDFDKNYDLDRIQKFYNKLNSIKIPDQNSITNAFREFASYQTFPPEYIFMGMEKIKNPSYTPSQFESASNSFLSKYHIKDKTLEKRIANIFEFKRGSYVLGDDNINLLQKDYIKNHLPKFQNGGLLQLQNGGKLQGYGGGDRNLALLEDGEFVIRKEAVSHFGADNFFKLNNLQLPKFQNGGLFNASAVSGGGARDVVDVNLNLGNKSYKMSADVDVAKQLTQDIKRIM